MTITIREAIAADAPLLSALGEQTFRETFLEDGFAIPYPAADLSAWLPGAYGVAKFAGRIDSPAYGVWIAEDAQGAAIGYATAGACGLPHPESSEDDGELYQLYVARAGQGTGTGARLFDTAIGWLEAQGNDRLWLGVWSGNVKAQEFYRRRGFEKVGEYQFPVGNWRDDEFIFRRG
jgi:ribosomal protein S18 acetylase RimI-like enzyme